MTKLKFFTALHTIHGIVQVFEFTIGTDFGLRLRFNRLTTAGAEFCVRRKVFSAVSALMKHQLLMTALRAEAGIDRNAVLTLRTQVVF